MPVAKKQIRQIIADNNLNSVADVYTMLKDSFRDILQELMEAELDVSLGYEKNHKGDVRTSNKQNGHSPKTLKSQYGEFQIDVPRDRDGEFEPNQELYGMELSAEMVSKITDSALEKMLYPASGNIVKKWTQRYRNWERVLNRLTVLYGELLTQYL